MTNGVNIYALMQRFWTENEYEPFSTAEIALYFFLVHRANCRRWAMPFKCPTELISHSIKVSRQTVVNARVSLMERGFISFTKGIGKGCLPEYSLVLTDKLSEGLSGNASESLTPYNMEDKKIKNNSSIKKAEEKILSLDELKDILVADSEWHQSLLSLLSKTSPITRPKLLELLETFFNSLKCKGIKEREETDCRTYFTNWAQKQLNSNNYGIYRQQQSKDQRRGTDVPAVTAESYHNPF